MTPSEFVSMDILEKLESLHREHKYNEELEVLRSLPILTKELKGRKGIVMVFIAVAADEKQRDLKLKLLDDALAFCKEYLSEDEENCLAHQLYLSCLSEKGRFEGSRHMAGYLKEIQHHTEIAMALDPNNPLNWHIVGSTAFELSALTWIQKQFVKTVYGISIANETIEKALESFLKADKLFKEPDLSNKFMMAKCLLTMEKVDMAKQLLEQVLQLDTKSQFDIRYKSEARELIKTVIANM